MYFLIAVLLSVAIYLARIFLNVSKRRPFLRTFLFISTNARDMLTVFHSRHFVYARQENLCERSCHLHKLKNDRILTSNAMFGRISWSSSVPLLNSGTYVSGCSGIVDNVPLLLKTTFECWKCSLKTEKDMPHVTIFL